MAIRLSSGRQKYDENVQIPRTLTSHLRDSLAALPSYPKTDYLKEEAFSKFVSEDTALSKVRRQRAINKWLATEANNEATNHRLLTLHEEYNILPRVAWGQFRETVRSFVTDVIGEVPSFDDLFGGFSGGASTSRKRTSSHPAEKYLGAADITASAAVFFEDLFSESPLWREFAGSDYIRIVEGNVLFTVPKNAEIDRCACKEPDLNMYLQRGLGNQIRAALKRKGIDLNDQSRNRDLARLGSISGELATLDLSSASDSISFELVQQMMPDIWLACLNALRSPVTIIDGEVHVNEMFSSMGNGFTFELESLLFYCISRAVAFHTNTRGTISVYGDDIIVPSEIALDVAWVLGILGFEVNTKKSFWTGNFRESCGGHYLHGMDVTPFYVKAPLRTLTDLIHVCNQLRKWSETDLGINNSDVEHLWQSLAKHVPSRFWGGHDTSFKGQLVSYWKPAKPKRLIPIPLPKEIKDEGQYLLWLDNGMKRETGVTDNVSTAVLPSGRYRAVRSPAFNFGKLDHLFLFEVMAE